MDLRGMFSLRILKEKKETLNKLLELSSVDCEREQQK